MEEKHHNKQMKFKTQKPWAESESVWNRVRWDHSGPNSWKESKPHWWPKTTDQKQTEACMQDFHKIHTCFMTVFKTYRKPPRS